MRLKIKQISLIIVFYLIIGLPYLIWPFVRNVVDNGNYENRDFAEKPKLEWECIENYSSDVENYINDYLPFRNQMIRINNLIQCYVFKNSSNKSVVLGREGWLFYNSKSDGDPIGDYKGTKLFTEEELKKIAENLTVTRDNLALEGCEFVLFIAPNKERIYSEFMPQKLGEPAETYATLQVVEYLQNHTDIRVVYPEDRFIETKIGMGDKLLYYKTDTHWNDLGAYVGATELLKELDIIIPDINSNEILVEEAEAVPGDLANMLNLGIFVNSDIRYTITGYDNYSAKKIEDNFWGAKVYENKGADPRKIFMRRDSFGSELMAEVIGSQFRESYLVHSNSYGGSDMVRQQQPDIFVYETVERYIMWLLKFRYE